MATRTEVDAILFDLGGVLVELTGVPQMMAWCPDIGDSAALWHRWLHSAAVRRFETGATSREAFADEVTAEFALPVAPGDFLSAFARWPRGLFPGTGTLLAELAPRYRLASVSNTNELHWDRFEREWSLPGLFHHNFPSYQVGKLKPDADYFEHVLAELDLPAGRVLFIDDNSLNVEAAQRMGMVARRTIGIDGVRATLAELGMRTP